MTALRHHLAAVSLALITLAVAVGACALPTDESAQVLSGEDIENAMRPTTTSTTRPVGSTLQREMYFYDADDLLVGVARPISEDTDIAEILTMLGQPPEDTDIRTTVPQDFLVTTTEIDDNGVLTVVLADDTLLVNLGGSELARAVAQIVATATQLDDSDITAVQFVVAGEDQARNVPAGPDLTDTDEPVDVCDYRQFLPPDVSCASLS